MSVDAAPRDGAGPASPGLMMLRGYQSAWLRYDVAAGLSVAAVALQAAIAYAQLAGFPPVVGLYASIVPLVFTLASARPLADFLGKPCSDLHTLAIGAITLGVVPVPGVFSPAPCAGITLSRTDRDA